MKFTTQQKANAFLKAFALTGSITRAAQAAGIDKTMHYRWAKKSPAYRAAFEAAAGEFGDELEAEAIRQAKEGVLTPVFYQGQKCGALRVFSPGLMQFLLRGFKPQKYSNRTEISGPEGGPIEIVERLNAARARMNEENAEAARKLAEAE